jgi:hypothetical protein
VEASGWSNDAADLIFSTGIVKTLVVCSDATMSQPSTRPALYKGYRFPPAIISYCVWIYFRFGVSLRDVSELMLARGIEVSHEAVRLWTLRFGTEYARRLRLWVPEILAAGFRKFWRLPRRGWPTELMPEWRWGRQGQGAWSALTAHRA